MAHHLRLSTKKLFTLSTLLFIVTTLWAQAPSGYYTAASGKKGASLKTALYSIISSHTNVGYDGLYAVYKKSDVRSDGKIWDMYSNTTSFDPDKDKGGNYSGEGDCYNREHSVPQSWFSKASPMKADAFHVIPTDGYVNNRRSNNPFGETSSPTWTSNNGFSKVGPCKSELGYSGVIFEPNDEYKGDFARIYFYMATAYEDKISSWGGVFGNGKYPGIATWQLNMLLQWAKDDPVSQKEIDRNNAVYDFQKNRNPYVDFPGLEQYVWGDKTDVAFDPTNYDGSNTGGDENDVKAPTFSPTSGVVDSATVVTISTTTDSANIYYSLNGGDEISAPSPVSVTITQATTITARAEYKGTYSTSTTATYTLKSNSGDATSTTWTKVTQMSDLQAGKRYIVVCEDKNVALAEATSNDIRSYAEVSISGSEISTEVGTSGHPYALTLGGESGAWTFYDAVGNQYLSLQTDKNKLHASSTADSDSEKWTITLSAGVWHIYNKEYSDREIQYNAGAPRFACYTGSQTAVSLYVNASTTDGISTVTKDGKSARVNVYGADGRLLRKQVKATDAHNGLPAGLYIIGGEKVLIR